MAESVSVSQFPWPTSAQALYEWERPKRELAERRVAELQPYVDALRRLLDDETARFFFEQDGGDPRSVEAGETALLGRPISQTEIREMVAGLS